MMTYDDAVKIFIDYAKHNDSSAPNKHWYVGITNNLERRKKEHEADKNICCKFIHSPLPPQNPNVARTLEKKLEKVGFAIYKKDLEPIQETASTQAEKIYIYIYQAVKLKND